jgi:hypothetical protein
MSLMKVYLTTSPKNYMRERTPIVVETNLAWAVPYWKKRKQTNPDLRWVIDPAPTVKPLQD